MIFRFYLIRHSIIMFIRNTINNTKMFLQYYKNTIEDLTLSLGIVILFSMMVFFIYDIEVLH